MSFSGAKHQKPGGCRMERFVRAFGGQRRCERESRRPGMRVQNFPEKKGRAVPGKTQCFPGVKPLNPSLREEGCPWEREGGVPDHSEVFLSGTMVIPVAVFSGNCRSKDRRPHTPGGRRGRHGGTLDDDNVVSVHNLDRNIRGAKGY